LISIEVDPRPSDAQLRELWLAVRGNAGWFDIGAVLSRSLWHLGAYDGRRLIGFVNVAWDGGAHASVFDTSVHPDSRPSGIGTGLVVRAVDLARQRGAHWLQVDFEPHPSSSTVAAVFARLRPG
jgi:GNAT superfamily N-acetyltransferase